MIRKAAGILSVVIRGAAALLAGAMIVAALGTGFWSRAIAAELAVLAFLLPAAVAQYLPGRRKDAS